MGRLLVTSVLCALASALGQAQVVSATSQPGDAARGGAAGPTSVTPSLRLPGDAAIERERQRVEQARKPMFDARNPATATAPHGFPNVATPAPAGVDPQALARLYESRAEARRTDGLLVFASFSLPKASLKRLIADTARAGGTVVLRGFKDGSLQRTALAVNELGVPSAGVQINPNAFVTYRVAAVPAIALVKPEAGDDLDADGCALPDRYVLVAGDVTLAFGLDHIAQRSPAFREMAERYARPLKGTAP